MNDVIKQMDEAASGYIDELLEVKQEFNEMEKFLEIAHPALLEMRKEARLAAGKGGVTSDDVKKINVGLTAYEEYMGRAHRVIEQFDFVYTKLVNYFKQIRVQLAISRSQLKFQHDVIAEEEILDQFMANIKRIAELIKKGAHHVSEQGNNLVINREIARRINEITEDACKLMKVEPPKLHKVEQTAPIQEGGM